MQNDVYKTLEITGSSPDSVEKAINNAIAKTGESINDLKWFTVSEIRGAIASGSVNCYQVTLKIGFKVN